MTRLCALALLVSATGCAATPSAPTRSGCPDATDVRVDSDASYPATTEWAELPESVRAQYVALAEAADPDQQLDRPPYPVGGMAGLMRGLSYPEGACREGAEGLVVVQAVVAADGSVADAEVVQSAHPLLDAEALAAVRRGRFEPARKDGRPVAATIRAPIRFALP